MWFRESERLGSKVIRRADWPGVWSLRLSGWNVDYGRRIYAWGLGRKRSLSIFR